MSRPLRIEYRGAYYHAMNRGTARQKIFLNDHDRQGFLDLLGRAWFGKILLGEFGLFEHESQGGKGEQVSEAGRADQEVANKRPTADLIII